MENNKNITPENDPNLDMGAHDPKVDMARNKNLFNKSLYVAAAFVVILIGICALQSWRNSRGRAEVEKALMSQFNSDPTDTLAQQTTQELFNTAASKGNSSAMYAKIVSAREAYEKGDYEVALKYVKGVKTRSSIIQTLKYCLEGDCYANLDRLNDAAKAFKKAVKEADENPELAPYAMHKLANVYYVQGEHAKEAAVLKEIKQKYPTYYPQIEAEVARAEQAAK